MILSYCRHLLSSYQQVHFKPDDKLLSLKTFIYFASFQFVNFITNCENSIFVS